MVRQVSRYKFSLQSKYWRIWMWVSALQIRGKVSSARGLLRSVAWRAYLLLGVYLWSSSSLAGAQSWVFQPSYYSHGPQGERIIQYSRPADVPVPYAPNYVVSGYRHSRSTIRGEESYDHLHIVKTWGLGEYIRPYEEWEFPFRPGATPFGPWGNPQGPWTLPFQSWINPFALGQLPNPPWWLYFPSVPGLVVPPPVNP